MKKVLEKINQLMDGIFNLLQAYSKVVLLAVVLIVCAQVVSRKFFNYSIIWSEEVALLLMVWMAFISMAIGVAKDIHIRITLFFDLFPKPVQSLHTGGKTAAFERKSGKRFRSARFCYLEPWKRLLPKQRLAGKPCQRGRRCADQPVCPHAGSDDLFCRKARRG